MNSCICSCVFLIVSKKSCLFKQHDVCLWKGFALSVCLFSEGEKPGLGHLRVLGFIPTSCLFLANYYVSLHLSFHFPTIEMAMPFSQEDKMSFTGREGSSLMPGSPL